jgi:hypothetical protein
MVVKWFLLEERPSESFKMLGVESKSIVFNITLTVNYDLILM